MLRGPSHETCDGIHVPFYLRSDILCIQVGRGNVAVGGSFPRVIQVMKQLLDIGQSVFRLEFASDVCFLPVLLRSL
jgi:hypothetical protein